MLDLEDSWGYAVVVYAYSYNKSDSAHGKRSSAEPCAKHLKEAIKSQ